MRLIEPRERLEAAKLIRFDAAAASIMHHFNQ